MASWLRLSRRATFCELTLELEQNEVEMSLQYFNHHATRTAIQVLVQMKEDNRWAGTGFFVQISKTLEEGAQIDCLLLISNKHVLAEGAGDQAIVLNKKEKNGEVRYGEQEIVGIDKASHRYTGHTHKEIDLACMDMRGIGLEGYDVPILDEGFLSELDENKVGIGSDVLYAGFPNGLRDRKNGLALMRKGSIASIPTMDCESEGLIAIDGTVLPGNSGGPVFVDYGDSYRLLGVMHAMSKIADDYGFAIKQRYVRELIRDATEKSSQELRQQADTIVRELQMNGDARDKGSIKREVWNTIIEQLDRVRQSQQ